MILYPRIVHIVAIALIVIIIAVAALVIVLVFALLLMWESGAQQRAVRYAAAEEADVAEAGTTEPATGFPVPPLDLPHYHGVGASGDNETSSKEVADA